MNSFDDLIKTTSFNLVSDHFFRRGLLRDETSIELPNRVIQDCTLEAKLTSTVRPIMACLAKAMTEIEFGKQVEAIVRELHIEAPNGAHCIGDVASFFEIANGALAAAVPHG